MISQNEVKLTVEFLVNSETNTKFDGSVVRLSSVRHSRSWRWILNEDSFENVYGLNKIIQLIPGDVATSVFVKLNRGGEGNFLVHHLYNLFLYYSQIHKDAEEPKMPYLKNIFALSPAAVASVAEHGANLPMSAAIREVCSHLSHVLHRLQTDQDPNLEGLKAAVRDLLDCCEDVYAMCGAYLDFIKPLWDLNNMAPGFSHADVIRDSAMAKIMTIRPKFTTTFQNLSSLDI